MTEIQWIKSSFSQGNGNCVEVGRWNKSSFSNGASACIEVSAGHPADGDDVFLRESDDPGVIVRTTAVKWAAFIAGAKAGEFDL
jgi:hypothetical protein